MKHYGTVLTNGNYDRLITIIHTNDVHSNVEVEPYVKGLADALRNEGKNVVIISAGDAFAGTPFASLSKGLDAAKVMNLVGYDLFTLGNHEQPPLMEISDFKAIAEAVDFRVLGANAPKDMRKAIPDIADYAIMEIAGNKIAFIGLTTPDMKSGTSGAEAVAAAEKAKKSAESEGAEIFVAVAHLGITANDETQRSTYLADRCPWLSAIIDAHCHTAHQNGMLRNGVLIAETGQYGINIGVTELIIKDGKFMKATASLIPIKGNEKDCGITPDLKVLAYLNEVNERNKPYLNEVALTLPVSLHGDRAYSRTRETNLGNLVTDAMRWKTKADIAFVTGLFIRADLAAGDITREQLETALYTDRPVCTFDYTGQQLYDMMETGLSMVPEPNIVFCHVSGMLIEFDPVKEAGSRITSIKLSDGSRLDFEATYTCATRYDGLAHCIKGNLIEGENYTAGFGSVCEIFAAYVNSGIEITGEIDGRLMPITKKSIENMCEFERIDKKTIYQGEVYAD